MFSYRNILEKMYMVSSVHLEVPVQRLWCSLYRIVLPTLLIPVLYLEWLWHCLLQNSLDVRALVHIPRDYIFHQAFIVFQARNTGPRMWWCCSLSTSSWGYRLGLRRIIRQAVAVVCWIMETCRDVQEQSRCDTHNVIPEKSTKFLDQQRAKTN